MTTEKVFTCHTISEGIIKGEALISDDHILFYKTDPSTGEVTEPGHDLEGKSIQGKILVFPGGKGSSSVQADGIYKLIKAGTAPSGFIVRELDTVLVSNAIIMGIPMVSELEEDFYAAVHNGLHLTIDTKNNIVKVHGELFRQ